MGKAENQFRVGTKFQKMKKLLLIFIHFLGFLNLNNAQDIITSKLTDIDEILKKQLDEKLAKYQLLTLSNIPEQTESMQFKLQLPTETWNVELETNEIRTEDFKNQQMDEKGMQTITLDKCPT
jgi:hypothetical protein